MVGVKKSGWVIAIILFAFSVGDSQVRNGIDILRAENFKSLRGLRVGLVTNQTGRSLDGELAVDLLHDAKNVNLVALFAPEHGLRGEEKWGDRIADARDEKTGLPIYSLFTSSFKPTPEQLAKVDVIIFDIQDIGTRFYTYISSLGNILEEAAKAKKPVIVLDRPNPINGVAIEGPLADGAKLGFTAYHTIPVRHGMTVGELALMFNAERHFGADLKVIRMENWSRSMWFDETGQTWVNPSPNIRNLTQATLYPAIGLLEATNLSVGRGTDSPFEIIGAPYIDGRELAKWLNLRGLGGVRFVPVRFTPNADRFQGEQCNGVNIIVTDREKFGPIRSGLEIALTLRKLYPDTWESKRYYNLLRNAQVFQKVLDASIDAKEIERDWLVDTAAFVKRRKRFLLYK